MILIGGALLVWTNIFVVKFLGDIIFSNRISIICGFGEDL